MNSLPMQLESTEVLSTTGMITPAGSIEQAIEQFELYQELKLRLGTPDDFQQIGNKKHPKKSFVRKVQRFFNISCELVEISPFRDETGKVIAWLAKAKAVHFGTGAFQEGDGACSYEEKTAEDPLKEKRLRTIHNVRSHAVTRAKNRAILDLVGFGEVSAEEINVGDYFSQETGTSKPTNSSLAGSATTNQRKAIFAIGKEKGLTKDEVKMVSLFHTKKESTQELTKQEASDLINLLKEAIYPELIEMVEAVEQVESSLDDTFDNSSPNVDMETGELI